MHEDDLVIVDADESAHLQFELGSVRETGQAVRGGGAAEVVVVQPGHTEPCQAEPCTEHEQHHAEQGQSSTRGVGALLNPAESVHRRAELGIRESHQRELRPADRRSDRVQIGRWCTGRGRRRRTERPWDGGADEEGIGAERRAVAVSRQGGCRSSVCMGRGQRLEEALVPVSSGDQVRCQLLAEQHRDEIRSRTCFEEAADRQQSDALVRNPSEQRQSTGERAHGADESQI